MIDLLLIRKDSTGAAATLTATDLDWEEAADFGAMVGGLIGWGVAGAEGAEIGWMAGAADSADGHALDEDDKFALLQTVPNGSSVGIVLIEHVWAKPLRAAVDPRRRRRDRRQLAPARGSRQARPVHGHRGRRCESTDER